MTEWTRRYVISLLGGLILFIRYLSLFTQLATKKVKPEEECLVITGEDDYAGQDMEGKEVKKSMTGMEVWYGNTLLSLLMVLPEYAHSH